MSHVIRNFAYRAHHLIKLTRKGAEWEFGEKQLEAMADLKDTLIKSPALQPINYKSSAPVILGVNTSYIAIGSILSHCDPENPKLRYVDVPMDNLPAGNTHKPPNRRVTV